MGFNSAFKGLIVFEISSTAVWESPQAAQLLNECMRVLDLLKPTCYVMHHQFNIQQLYALPTLYLCVLYLAENKQRLVQLTA